MCARACVCVCTGICKKALHTCTHVPVEGVSICEACSRKTKRHRQRPCNEGKDGPEELKEVAVDGTQGIWVREGRL